MLIDNKKIIKILLVEYAQKRKNIGKNKIDKSKIVD